MSLLPHHRTMLTEESGISEPIIQRRDYRSVEDKKELEALGFSPTQRNVPALLIPIHSPAGHVSLYQSRPDAPRLNNKGKPVKYETPSGSRMTLDVHPCARDKLGDPSTDLFITEGVKKGDALVSRGLCVVALIGVWNWRGTNGLGGKTALPEWEDIALNGRTVYIVFDSDVMTKKEVHAALARLKGFLEHRQAKVKLIYLPGDDEAKQGVDDFLAAGHSIRDLLALASSELRTIGGTARPQVVVNGRFLRDISADAQAALVEANDPPRFFVRGSSLTRVSEGCAEALTNASLKGELDRCADFVRETTRPATDEEKKQGKETVTVYTPTRPPHDLPPDLLSRPDLPFPRLEAISRVPVVLPGGVMLLENGYDPESNILLELDGLTGLRSDMPTDEALTLLDDVYGDFPFAEVAGKAHSLALTLQPFVRPLISGPTPLYLIDAPARGTGKGLLSETTALITLGYPAPVMSQPKDGDELEKRITAALLEGRSFCLLDNVTQLSSPHLAAALTAELWQGRMLGKSEMLTLPNTATWLATGNNVEISDEFARRIIPIRLDAGVERPEERRGFKHANLPEHVKSHRCELVSACLSLVQAWIDAGMPKGEATLGRYESWAGVLGGILEVSGIPGFLEGRERLHAEADSETTEWAAFTERWWATYKKRAVTAKDLFEILGKYKLLLDLWGGRSELSAMQRIGRALSSKRDRVFGGYAVRSAGKDSATKNAAYRLEPTSNQTPETPLNTASAVLNAPSDEGVSETELPEHPATPLERPQNTQEEKRVQDGTSQLQRGDTGVSGVSERPATEEAVEPSDEDDWGEL